MWKQQEASTYPGERLRETGSLALRTAVVKTVVQVSVCLLPDKLEPVVSSWNTVPKKHFPASTTRDRVPYELLMEILNVTYYE